MIDKLKELSESVEELLEQLHGLIKSPLEIDFEIIEEKKEGYPDLDNPPKNGINPV